MTTFPRPLHFDNAGMLGNRRRIILTAPFEAITSLGQIMVPKGFVSDGASIPQCAWSIVGNPLSEYLEEAVVHDWLYSAHNHEWSRSEADLIFRELMWNNDINRAKLVTMWMMVRMFGRFAFKGKPQGLRNI